MADKSSVEADFEHFVESTQSMLYRAAWLLCGSGPDAEDLVQETFSRMWKIWAESDLDNPAGYARTTLARLYIRSSKRHLAARSFAHGDASDVPMPQVDHAAVMATRQALMKLSERDRAILILHYYYDDSLLAISERLRMSHASVRTRASRARQRLSQLLQEVE